MNSQKFALILSGIIVTIALVNLSNYLATESESETIQEKPDPEAVELSNKMILLMHWQFITDTTVELSADVSENLQTKKFDMVQEKLKYFSTEYDRHKSNLQALDIIEKYQPVRNKMIQYVELTQDALEQTSTAIRNNDSEAMDEATNSLIKAKDVKNEISTIIKVW